MSKKNSSIRKEQRNVRRTNSPPSLRIAIEEEDNQLILGERVNGLEGENVKIRVRTKILEDSAKSSENESVSLMVQMKNMEDECVKLRNQQVSLNRLDKVEDDHLIIRRSCARIRRDMDEIRANSRRNLNDFKSEMKELKGLVEKFVNEKRN